MRVVTRTNGGQVIMKNHCNCSGETQCRCVGDSGERVKATGAKQPIQFNPMSASPTLHPNASSPQSHAIRTGRGALTLLGSALRLHGQFGITIASVSSGEQHTSNLPPEPKSGCYDSSVTVRTDWIIPPLRITPIRYGRAKGSTPMDYDWNDEYMRWAEGNPRNPVSAENAIMFTQLMERLKKKCDEQCAKQSECDVGKTCKCDSINVTRFEEVLEPGHRNHSWDQTFAYYMLTGTCDCECPK